VNRIHSPLFMDGHCKKKDYPCSGRFEKYPTSHLIDLFRLVFFSLTFSLEL